MVEFVHVVLVMRVNAGSVLFKAVHHVEKGSTGTKQFCFRPAPIGGMLRLLYFGTVR